MSIWLRLLGLIIVGGVTFGGLYLWGDVSDELMYGLTAGAGLLGFIFGPTLIELPAHLL